MNDYEERITLLEDIVIALNQKIKTLTYVLIITSITLLLVILFN